MINTVQIHKTTEKQKLVEAISQLKSCVSCFFLCVDLVANVMEHVGESVTTEMLKRSHWRHLSHDQFGNHLLKTGGVNSDSNVVYDTT